MSDENTTDNNVIIITFSAHTGAYVCERIRQKYVCVLCVCVHVRMAERKAKISHVGNKMCDDDINN